MPRRSRKKKAQDPISLIAKFLPRKAKTTFVFLANALLILVAAVWFAFQPPVRQQEVTKIVSHYLDGNRHINLSELVYDIYNLYYGTPAIPCDYKPGQSPVYGGLPKRTDGTGLTVLANQAYWVGYDEARRNPAWSAYKLVHTEHPNSLKRPSQFFTDTRTIAKVASDDYTGSGFDRGHLAPNHAIGRCFGSNPQQETFLMSNIVPQRHALNAGNWKELETKEAVNYPDRFDSIWIIAGPVFTAQTPRCIPAGIPVPDAFFKIQIDEREGAVRTQAFIFPHKGKGTENLETLLVTVRDIEKATGLDFFSDLSPEEQEKIENTKSTSLW